MSKKKKAEKLSRKFAKAVLKAKKAIVKDREKAAKKGASLSVQDFGDLRNLPKFMRPGNK